MDPDVTPEPEKTKASPKNLLAPLKSVLTPLKTLPAVFKKLLTPFAKLPTVLKNLLTPLAKLTTVFKQLLTPLKMLTAVLGKLPIPEKLVIPAIAGAVVLLAGAAFGLVHARLGHAGAPQGKAVASASVASTPGPAAACSGVVRDIYRQTVDEDPSVTLADVRSEVMSSGISCAPDPEIAAQLKDLSPDCRDMVQYTFLGVRDGHSNITVNDVREKVVAKSVACEHDRPPNIAASARHTEK